MKAMKYLFLAAAACFALTSCLDGDDSLLNDDWKDPTIEQAPFGNNAINEENVITIAELKAHPNYKTAIANSGNKLVEDDLKLRVFVTGNDIGGNLYKQFAVQDQTGALIVAVNQGGLSGFLPEGQQIIIDLKGLYIGGYGSQIPPIGTMPRRKAIPARPSSPSTSRSTWNTASASTCTTTKGASSRWRWRTSSLSAAIRPIRRTV